MASYQVLSGVLNIRLIFLSRKNFAQCSYLPALIYYPIFFLKSIKKLSTCGRLQINMQSPLCGMRGYTRITNSLQVYYIIVFQIVNQLTLIYTYITIIGKTINVRYLKNRQSRYDNEIA